MISFTSNLMILYVSIFIAGPLIIGRMSCGFLLVMEVVHSRNQSKVGASMMVAEGASLIVWTIYFKFLSQNAFPFMYFATTLNFVTAFLCFWTVESPRYLFGMEEFEKCKAALATIARRNGVQDYVGPVFDEELDILVEDLDSLMPPSSPGAMNRAVLPKPD